MISIRYKPVKSGRFSIYLDIYNPENKVREYRFLKIYVTQDYSKSNRIKEIDREHVDSARAIKGKMDLMSISDDHQLGRKLKNVPELIEFAEAYYKKTNDYNDKAVIIHLKEFIGKNKVLVSNVSPELLESFKKTLMGKMKKNSAATYLARLRAMLTKAVDQKYLLENPFKKIKLPFARREDIQRTTLTIEDIRALQNTATTFNPQIRQAFFLACFTGLRLSDVQRLEWTCIGTDSIKFVPYKTRNTTSKTLEIPLTEQARDILSEIKKRKGSNLVFWNLPVNTSILNHIKLWGLQSGIKQNLHFHAARHSFATIGLTYGIDIYTMKELLGHSKLATTEIYAKIVDQKKQTEIAKFPKI